MKNANANSLTPRRPLGFMLLMTGLTVIGGPCSPSYKSGETRCSALGECPDDFVCASRGPGAADVCVDRASTPCAIGQRYYCLADNFCSSGPVSCSVSPGTGGAPGSGGGTGQGGAPLFGGAGGAPGTGGVPGTGGTPDTPTQTCLDFANVVCGRIVACNVVPELRDVATCATLFASADVLDCASVRSVAAAYAICRGSVQSLPCATLFPGGELDLPDACTEVFSTGEPPIMCAAGKYTCADGSGCCANGTVCGSVFNDCPPDQCCDPNGTPVCDPGEYSCADGSGCCANGTVCGTGNNGCAADKCCNPNTPACDSAEYPCADGSGCCPVGTICGTGNNGCSADACCNP